MDHSWLDYHNWETPRWKTAIGSRKISFPMRRALQTGIITPETSVLDFGCGRNNDVESLKERGIAAVGFDPYWENRPELLQPTDVVSCIYVLNTVERDWEIPEVIQYCWELTRKSLILAIRTGDDHEENTSIGTYQYYWKPKSWRRFVQELGFDAEFPEAGIAVIHRKDTAKCYNSNTLSNATNMNIKSLRKFLSISPDKEGNSAPITLEYEHGILQLTYSKSGMLVKLPYSLNGGDEKWSIIVDHSFLMEAIASLKSKEDVGLTVINGDLRISNKEIDVTVFPWGKKIAEFDPDTLELDSQVIQFDGKRWGEFQAAARVAKLNKKGVNPEIVGKGVHCHAWGEYMTVSAWSETVSCSRTLDLDGAYPISEARDFVLPLEAIDLVTSMKPSQVNLTLDYQFGQLLIETDIGYVLVDVLKDKYPVADGIQKGFDASVQIKRKDLKDAVQAAVDGGAKSVTLVFGNNTVIVEAAKVKKQEILVENADTKKQIVAAIKVGATALLEALKAIAATKILIHLPMAAANSLILDTVTGIMYVLVVTVKTAAQIIETAADVLRKPEPTKEVVASGTNSDGSTFVVEAVEISPLAPSLSVEEKEEKTAKFKEEFGEEKAEIAESVLDVVDLREKVRGIIKQIDPEVERLRALSTPSNTAGIKGLDEVQAGIQQEAQQRLKELLVLRKELASVVDEAEMVEAAIDCFETEFSIEGLKAVELKLTWWGGRTLQFLWKEESQWLPCMRISEPMAIAHK
jgi:hypothetical protein